MKTALVTGGNKGIGFEICRNLAEAGCRVLLGARDRMLGRAAMERLKTEGFQEIEFVELDITQDQSVDATAQQIESTYGHLDILVNNAGINVAGDGPPSTADLDAVRRVLETNFIGAVRVTQAFLPLVKKAESGRVVNVSSELGSLSMNSDPEWDHYNVKLIGYCASKSAINMLTVQLAWELRGTKVKVNSANPGFTKTDLNANTGTQPVEVGAIAATKLAMLDDDGPTGTATSKDGQDPW